VGDLLGPSVGREREKATGPVWARCSPTLQVQVRYSAGLVCRPTFPTGAYETLDVVKRLNTYGVSLPVAGTAIPRQYQRLE